MITSPLQNDMPYTNSNNDTDIIIKAADKVPVLLLWKELGTSTNFTDNLLTHYFLYNFVIFLSEGESLVWSSALLVVSFSTIFLL